MTRHTRQFFTYCPGMTDAQADKESLRFLVNPAYHSLLQKSTKNEATEDKRRRYRHKINELHRSLMHGACPEASLKAAHDVFVGAAIRYIRFEEKRLLVEEELEGLQVCETAQGDDTQPVIDIASLSAKAFGKEKKAQTIDAFVTRTINAPPTHVPRRRRKKKSKVKVEAPGHDDDAGRKKKEEKTTEH